MISKEPNVLCVGNFEIARVFLEYMNIHLSAEIPNILHSLILQRCSTGIHRAWNLICGPLTVDSPECCAKNISYQVPIPSDNSRLSSTFGHSNVRQCSAAKLVKNKRLQKPSPMTPKEAICCDRSAFKISRSLKSKKLAKDYGIYYSHLIKKIQTALDFMNLSSTSKDEIKHLLSDEI